MKATKKGLGGESKHGLLEEIESGTATQWPKLNWTALYVETLEASRIDLPFAFEERMK